MGFWRGYRVWDVWAVHAFTFWGCDHLPQWQGLFAGLSGPEPPIEEALAAATRLTEPSEWRRIYEKEATYACNNRELSLSMYWAIGCLKDAALTEKLIGEIAVEEKDDPITWLLIADMRARLGMAATAVGEAIEQAEATARNGLDATAIADAWLGHLADVGRAETYVETIAKETGQDLLLHFIRPDMAWILHRLSRVVAALPRYIEKADDSIVLEAAGVAAAFLDDDYPLARCAFGAIVEKLKSGEAGVGAAQSIYHVFRDIPLAHEILGVWAKRCRTRESIYELADDWLQSTGDRVGARMLFDAARPRPRVVRSPIDWLEWVENVLLVLHDEHLAAEGIREAEKCARGELMSYEPEWDAIADAWLRLGKDEEARRALEEGALSLSKKTQRFPVKK